MYDVLFVCLCELLFMVVVEEEMKGMLSSTVLVVQFVRVTARMMAGRRMPS